MPILEVGKLLIGGHPVSNVALQHWNELLCAYVESGLAPPNLRAEIKTGEEQKLWAFLWEAMLYRHFSELTFQFRRDHVRRAGQDGPDLGLINNNRTIWIEAVVPKPERLPAEWLAPVQVGEVRVRTVPHQEMILRWTSVLKDKSTQLEKRICKGVVANGDAYIVAINSLMLSFSPADDFGISQLPYAVEVAFPIGPLAAQIPKDGKSAGRTVRTLRWSIEKAPGKDIPTGAFLRPEYAGISAIIASSRNNMLDGSPHLIAVHNPLAKNRLPTGLLGAEIEFIAEDKNDGHYVLKTTDAC